MNAVKKKGKIICIKINHFTRDALKSIRHISVKWNIYYRTFLLPSSAVTRFLKRKLCRLSVNWGLSTKSKRKIQHRLKAKLTTCLIVFGLICRILFSIVLFDFLVGKETISTRQILSVPFASGDWLNSELEI